MYNRIKGITMEISEITLKLLFEKVERQENKIESLENEIERLKNQIATQERKLAGLTKPAFISSTTASENTEQPTTSKRDTTRYMFNNNVYLKNRLVWAVVKQFVKDNPHITREQLKQSFPKSLQGSIGVVEDDETAKLRSDYTVRFFTKPEETLTLADGTMYVCTQWGILNIPRFLTRARQLGYRIDEIK